MKHKTLFYILGKFYMQEKMIFYKWENDYKHHLAAWDDYSVKGKKISNYIIYTVNYDASKITVLCRTIALWFLRT